MKTAFTSLFALLLISCGSSSTTDVEIHPNFKRQMGALYTVENTDPFPWKNVTIEFNGNWTFKIDKLPAGQSQTFLASDAADDVGHRMDTEIKVSSVMICCIAKGQSSCAEMLFK